jgi:hypothetical protein
MCYTFLPTSVVGLTCGVTITRSMEEIPQLNQKPSNNDVTDIRDGMPPQIFG